MDAKKLRQLEETEGKVFSKNWYGQLMATSQMFAYMIQLEYWLEQYNVVIQK